MTLDLISQGSYTLRRKLNFMDYIVWWTGLITVALALTYVEIRVWEWWEKR